MWVRIRGNVRYMGTRKGGEDRHKESQTLRNEGKKGHKGDFRGILFWLATTSELTRETSIRFARPLFYPLSTFTWKFRAVSQMTLFLAVFVAVIRLCLLLFAKHPVTKHHEYVIVDAPLKLRMASIAACAMSTQISWTRSQIYDLRTRDHGLIETIY